MAKACFMYTFCHNFVPPIRFGGYSSKNADLILAWGVRCILNLAKFLQEVAFLNSASNLEKNVYQTNIVGILASPLALW